MAHLNLERRLDGSPILRYGFSAAAVTIALGVSLISNAYGFRDVELLAFTLAIAFVTWYAGGGPSALAVVLSATSFNYFFTEPRYTLYVTASEIPFYLIFVAWALIIAVFAAVRRRAERDLLQARHNLQTANKELEILRLLGVSRSARAAAPHRGLRRTAATTGVFGARREESALRGDDPGVVEENGQPDRRPAGLLEDRASRNRTRW